MRRFFCIAIVMLMATPLLFAGITRQKTYLFNAEPASPSQSAIYASKDYDIVYYWCGVDFCKLECSGIGSKECSWSSASCSGCTGGITVDDPNSSNPNSLYLLGEVEALFSYVETQIDNGVHSGSYNSHLIKNGKTYYRTVTWSHSTTTGYRNYTAAITEDTP